jgi:hypothetical protein
MKLANGYILHETEQTVIIATGVNTKSTNEKTGAMIQIYALVRSVDPITANRMGLDKEHICFDCPHSGVINLETGRTSERTCYVTLMHGPSAVYRAYRNGSYPKLSIKDAAAVFTGRAVRFGAYGETCIIPRVWYRTITAVCGKWTGYSHQWKHARYAWLREFVMASCDSPADYHAAVAMGWRTFRVTPKGTKELATFLPGEVNCPASLEGGYRSECSRCGLCAGTLKQAKNVYIEVHGTGANSFKILQ